MLIVMMKTPLCLLAFLLLLTCNQQDNKHLSSNNIERIDEIHQRIAQGVADADSVYLYLKESEQLIHLQEVVSDSLKGENDYLLGMHFMRQGNLDSATVYLHRATESVRQSPNKRQAYYFYNAWNAYVNRGRFGDCFTISNRFRSLLDEKEDSKWMTWVHYFDEITYKRMADFPKALASSRLRVRALELTKDSLKLASALISQSEIQYSLKDKKAAFTILDGLIEQEEILTNDHKRHLYGNYGVHLFYEGEYEKSLAYYKKGLGFTKQTRDRPAKRNLLATAYSNIAEAYIELKAYKKAQIYMDSVKGLGTDRLDFGLQKNSLKYQLQLAFLTENEVGEVINYLDTIFKYQDQHYETKFTKELVDLEKANQKEQILLAEKQAAEIKNLKLQSRLLLSLILLSLMSVAGFLFYRQRKYRFEKQSLQMQQRLLRAQMNPHFMFNTLYTIQNLIKADQKAASNYLVKFSRLLRLILENSMLNYVQMDKELESLRKYLDLQLLRFPEKFDYEIVLNQLEEDDLVFIPPMLLQPIVENCIEHGFSQIKYKGHIVLTISKDNEKYLRCTVDDNGMGFQESENEAKQSTSTRLISSFLEKVSKSKIEVINKKEQSLDERGVVVKFLIPFKTSEDD